MRDSEGLIICPDPDSLEYLAQRMHKYNLSVAPGTECEAWQDFVDDCVNVLGIVPWDDPGLNATDSLRSYWTDVCNGVSSDYNPITGSRIYD